MKRPALLVPLLLAAVLSGSCGSGSFTDPGPPVITFAPQVTAAPGVHLNSGQSSADRLLEIVVISEGVPDVYAFEYRFSYPERLFDFEGFEEYDFLSENGAVDTRLTVTEVRPGLLRVEHTRVGAVGGYPEPLHSEIIHSVRLRAVESGRGDFTFVDPRAEDARGRVIPDVNWVGGAVQVALR